MNTAEHEAVVARALKIDFSVPIPDEVAEIIRLAEAKQARSLRLRSIAYFLWAMMVITAIYLGSGRP